jgi:hypothetical protein
LTDKFINELNEVTVPVDADLLPVETAVATTPETKKLTWANLLTRLGLEINGGGLADGWTASGETWTYASADSPTFTFTISGDKTTKYKAGQRIKLTQTTAKYFIITKVAYSAPNTTVTIYGGTDYTLANAAITSPYYSREKAPFGFPLEPDKWTVSTVTSDSPAKASPTASTWYGDTGLSPTGPSISIPIGSWRVRYETSADLVITLAAVGNIGCRMTLSTANNSESDPELTTGFLSPAPIGTVTQRATYNHEKVLTLTAKTTYYLNVFTGNSSVTSMTMNAAATRNIIKATCAYL